MTKDVLMLDDKNQKRLKRAFLFSIISVASAFLISGIVGIVFAIMAWVSCKKVKKARVTEQNYAKLTYTNVITIIGIIMSVCTIIARLIIAAICVVICLVIIIILPFIIIGGGIAVILSGLGSIGTLFLPFLAPILEELIMLILAGLADAIVESIMSEVGFAAILMMI